MRKRLGIVCYLNTAPLVYGIEEPQLREVFDAQYDVPSVCAEKLVRREVDLALIPSIEYARAEDAYRIVPGICIASQRTVRSVVVWSEHPLGDVKRVALDPASRTSAALLRIIMAEKYDNRPEYVSSESQDYDCRLVIGDPGLFETFPFPLRFDLGEEWHSLTGLPFVFAFWAGWPDAVSGTELKVLSRCKDEGLAHIDEIGGRYAKEKGGTPELNCSYLRQSVSYDFGGKQMKGLLVFFALCHKCGLISRIPDLRFYG